MSNKSNLTILATTIAATGAVVVGTGTNVHADTVKAFTPEQVQTVKAQDQKLDDDINQAQNDVNDAQKNADQTQNAANDAKQTADDSQKNADQASDQANQAQNDVNDQKKQNDQANQDVENAQNDVNHAQDNVNDAKSNANQAQNNANQADDAASKAQDDVNHAQADLDKGNHAQADLDQAQDDLNCAKDNASKAENGANQADQAENDAAKKANDAKKKADDAAKAQSDAQHKADAANKAKDDAQKALDDAKSHQGNPNQVHLSQDYLDALKAFSNSYYGDPNYQTLLDNLAKAAQKNYKATGYVSVDGNTQIKINSQADLDKYLNELNQYAQQLINGIRDQLGTKGVELSKGSEELSRRLSDAYTNNNWDGMANGHDATTNTNVANGMGLDGSSAQDLTSGYFTSNMHGDWDFTLDDFMKALYNSIIEWMFNDGDSEWAHTTSVAGLDAIDSGYTEYMGIGFWKFNPDGDYMGIPNSDGMFRLDTMLNLTYDYMIPENSEFDTTPIKSDVPSQSTIDQLTNDLKAKQADANAANKALATAKANNAKAQAALNTANAALNAVKANQAKAHANLTQAQAAVKDAQAAVMAAQKALDEANANHAAKQEALDDAKAKLADAQANQAQKHAILNDANAKLAKANKALADTQAKLAAAQAVLAAGQQALADKEAKLNDLKNADKVLADAKAAVEAAQKAYDDAKTAANQAQAQADADEATYERLQALADKAAKALADAKARLAQLEHQRDINDAIDGVDNDSKGSDKNHDVNTNRNGSNTSNGTNSSDTSNTWDDPTVSNNSAISNGSSTVVTPAMGAARAMSNRSRSQVVKASMLPQTGETNNDEGSMIGLALLSLLGAFGLAKTSRRRMH
ncbi:SEC10/PgrA surface exclusion domain-containing protein [Pediococcus acidilactici]